MKRSTSLILPLFIILLTLSTSPISPSSCIKKTKPVPSTPQSVKRIRISGSKTCLPLMKILAKAYQEKNPGVIISFPPGAHSSAGIKGVHNGTLEIGSVSRELKPEEQKLGLKYYVLSRDGLAIATNKNVHIKNLTMEQIRKIYAGTITNWKEVGGPDAAIVVLDRAEDESAKIILRRYVLGNTKVTPKATLLFLESDMVEALKKTPYAIGYLSLGYAISESLPLNLVSVDGVAPSVKNIYKGRYKIVRPLGIVTRKKVDPAVSDFLRFVRGEGGRKVMERYGYAGVK